MPGCADHGWNFVEVCSTCRAAKKMQTALEKGKIGFVGQHEIEILAPEIRTILEALGHPEAWVSDRSSVWDFCPTGRSSKKQRDDSRREMSKRLTDQLGVSVKVEDLLVDIALRMRQKEMNK